MIYVYRCERCDIEVEKQYRMGKQPEHVDCPRCGLNAERVFLAPAVHYKGFGWTGAGHGDPDMDDREKMPRPWEFDDILEDAE